MWYLPAAETFGSGFFVCRAANGAGKGGNVELYATELMGSLAYDIDGHFVGRVREFFIEPAEQSNRISHYLLSRGRFQPLVARYDQVASVEPGNVRLNVSERALEVYRPNEAWLAVRKDLMDQQIIDTHGRKVVRVNDVDLTELRNNGSMELRVAQVDVGLPGAVRRLLQGVVSPAVIRKLQRGLPHSTIRWEFVNLIEPDPLRRVKLRITHEKLEDLHPADLAELMEHLSAAAGNHRLVGRRDGGGSACRTGPAADHADC
jgi:magnesium transporter